MSYMTRKFNQLFFRNIEIISFSFFRILWNWSLWIKRCFCPSYPHNCCVLGWHKNCLFPSFSCNINFWKSITINIAITIKASRFAIRFTTFFTSFLIYCCIGIHSCNFSHKINPRNSIYKLILICMISQAIVDIIFF